LAYSAFRQVASLPRFSSTSKQIAAKLKLNHVLMSGAVLRKTTHSGDATPQSWRLYDLQFGREEWRVTQLHSMSFGFPFV
jgi:hypothetical protein